MCTVPQLRCDGNTSCTAPVTLLQVCPGAQKHGLCAADDASSGDRPVWVAPIAVAPDGKSARIELASLPGTWYLHHGALLNDSFRSKRTTAEREEGAALAAAGDALAAVERSLGGRAAGKAAPTTLPVPTALGMRLVVRLYERLKFCPANARLAMHACNLTMEMLQSQGRSKIRLAAMQAPHRAAHVTTR